VIVKIGEVKNIFGEWGKVMSYKSKMMNHYLFQKQYLILEFRIFGKRFFINAKPKGNKCSQK